MRRGQLAERARHRALRAQEEYAVFRARLELCQAYVSLGRRGFALPGGLAVPPHGAATCSAATLALLLAHKLAGGWA